MKQVIIERVEVCRDGSIRVFMQKQDLEDGELQYQQPHRCMLMPGDDIEAMKKAVNENMKGMKWPEVSDEEWKRVQLHTDVAWTPEVCKAWAVAVEAAKA